MIEYCHKYLSYVIITRIIQRRGRKRYAMEYVVAFVVIVALFVFWMKRPDNRKNNVIDKSKTPVPPVAQVSHRSTVVPVTQTTSKGGFTGTKRWQSWYFDERNQKIFVILRDANTAMPQYLAAQNRTPHSSITFAYSQISDVQVIQDVSNGRKGNVVGRAVVGGILTGGIGAVVGAASGLKSDQYCNLLKVRVTLSNGQFIDEYFVQTPVKMSNVIYSGCNTFYGMMSEAYHIGHPGGVHIDLTE